MVVKIRDQRRDQVVKQGEKWPQSLGDSSVGRNVVPVGVPGARGGVVTEIEGDKADAGLDQPPCQQGLLTPQMFPVTFADAGRLLADIECSLGSLAENHVDSFLLVRIQRVHRSGLVEILAEAVKLLDQRLSCCQAVCIETCRDSQQIGTADTPGVDTDLRVDRKSGGVIGDEGVVLFAEVAGKGKMGSGSHERGVRRHAGMIGPVHLGDNGSDRRIEVPLGVGSWGCLAVPGLEHHVGFVTALARID